MATFNPKFDEYISKSADFAKPILEYLRKTVHDICPDVEEKVKWGMPHFDYLGEMMCHMAAFKQHCAFGFWKAPIIRDEQLLINAKSESAMGHLGRISNLNDLPSHEKLTGYIKEAMELNEKGIKINKSTNKIENNKELSVPSEFYKLLNSNPLALEYFEKGSYSFKKEYVTWVVDAKTEATKLKRMQQALEWLAEGKSKNWKYER